MFGNLGFLSLRIVSRIVSFHRDYLQLQLIGLGRTLARKAIVEVILRKVDHRLSSLQVNPLVLVFNDFRAGLRWFLSLSGAGAPFISCKFISSKILGFGAWQMAVGLLLAPGSFSENLVLHVSARF